MGERIAPAILSWTGNGGNDLVSTAGNWDLAMQPDNGDTLLFPGGTDVLANGRAVFDGNAPSTLARLETSGAYSGNLLIERTMTITDLMHGSTQPGSILVDTNFTLTVSTAHLVGGTLGGGGTVEVSSGAAPALSIGGITSVQVAALNIRSAATMNVSHNLTFSGNAQMLSEGTVNWSGGNVTVLGGSTITNQGTFNVTTDSAMFGPGPFSNTGQVVKHMGVGLTTFAIPFNNGTGAIVQINTGSITFSGGGTDSGTYNVNSGTLVTFITARTLNGTSIWEGNGSVILDTKVSIPAGSSLQSNVGSLTFKSDVTHLEGTGASGAFTANGAIIWLGGKLEKLGTVTGLWTLGIQGPLVKYLDDTTLVLTDQTAWSGGQIELKKAHIHNSGVFDIDVDGLMKQDGLLESTFQNLAGGVVRKNVGVNDTTFNLTVTNSGELLLGGKKLKFEKGLSQSGSGMTDLGFAGVLNLGAGRTFYISGGTLRGSGTIGGALTVVAGRLEVQTGGMSVQGNYIQGSGATLSIEYSNAYAVLAVTGSASLLGSLEINVTAGNPNNQWADILTTGTTVSGGFENPTPDYEVRYIPGGAPNKVQVRKP